jgi:riboflavin kinase/FMN adenylyltransferase
MAPEPAPIDRLPAVGEAAVCMGVFDGVHRGHLALVGETVRAAEERGLRSVALVFEPHPDEVVRPGTVVPRLAPLAENLRRLAAAGIDAPLPVRFGAELRARTAEDFLAAMAPAVRVRALVMTPESAFGRNRAGTPETMAAHGRDAGFDLVLVQHIVEDDGAPISSGRVRDAVRAGDIDAATRLLGHPPIIEAVTRPNENGWALSFAYPAALPSPGRYRVTTRPASGSSLAAEAVLIVRQDDIGLEGLEGGGAEGETVGLELLERIGS